MAAQATGELQHIPQFKFSVVLEKLTFSLELAHLWVTTSARYF
jgi:hypothetical protein